jgi:Bacterial PH domain
VDSWLRSVNDGVDAGEPTGPEPGVSVGATWSPSGGLVAVAWLGTAAAAVWCVLVAGTADRAGLLLAAVAAVGLGFAALYGTRARPRLRVDAAGLTVGGLGGPRRYAWRRVGDVRVLAVRRLGRTSTLLEVDVRDGGPDDPERLLVFGRLDLDADPDDVAAVVRAVRERAVEHEEGP